MEKKEAMMMKEVLRAYGTDGSAWNWCRKTAKLGTE